MPELNDFGPAKVGYRLEINGDVPSPGSYTIDAEWTEDDVPVLVGISVVPTYGEKVVRYFTGLPGALVDTLERSKLSGHGVKADFHELGRAGVRLTGSQIEHDSMILAYSQSSTKEKYGLKDLAKETLGWSWPTYKEIVGKGRGKKTLEKHDVDLVARYCGMDAAAARELIAAGAFGVSTWDRRIYYDLELPVYRCLFDIEARGIQVDKGYLEELDHNFSLERGRIESELADIVANYESGRNTADVAGTGKKVVAFNPASPAQVLTRFYPAIGVKARDTNVNTLRELGNHEPIRLLIRFRELSKLVGTYCRPLAERGVVHCSFNQVSVTSEDDSFGIRTGRLSSSNPNLQNIPARTDTGKLIRKAFVARPGTSLVVADYSQVEYRVLAHFTGEKVLIDAFNNGVDVHEATARRILGIKGDVQKADRDIGKTINFAVIYGAQAKKIARTCKRSEKEAQGFLDAYFVNLPRVVAWTQHIRNNAKLQGGIKTLMGRWIPLGSTQRMSDYEIFAFERRAVNYVVQGSAAEILKIAMVRLCNMGFKVLLQVHDELVIEAPEEKAEWTAKVVKGVMENAVRLKIPLEVEVGTGQTWLAAK